MWQRRGLALLTIVNIFAVVLIVSYGLSAWKDFKAIRGEEKLQITLSGEGKVMAKPDVAKISATILTENESLKIAQEENSRKSNVLTSFLKGVGIAEKDIRTIGYNIYPQYSYPPPCPPYSLCPLGSDRPKIVGYQVRNSYEVTIRDLGKTGEILSGIIGSGVNEVSGITFTIDEPEALQAEARKKAIDNARDKAKKLAADLDRRLGKIVNFSESGGFPPIIFREAAFGGKGGGGAEPIPPSVEPGENEVIVNVAITYEFK
mgnify:FL=1